MATNARVLVIMLGLDKIARYMGLSCFATGLAFLLGPPVAGMGSF